MPFSHSYRVIGKGQILTLRLKDWKYLVKHFQKSRNLIFKDKDDEDKDQDKDRKRVQIVKGPTVKSMSDIDLTDSEQDIGKETTNSTSETSPPRAPSPATPSTDARLFLTPKQNYKSEESKTDDLQTKWRPGTKSVDEELKNLVPRVPESPRVPDIRKSVIEAPLVVEKTMKVSASANKPLSESTESLTGLKSGTKLDDDIKTDDFVGHRQFSEVLPVENIAGSPSESTKAVIATPPATDKNLFTSKPEFKPPLSPKMQDGSPIDKVALPLWPTDNKQKTNLTETHLEADKYVKGEDRNQPKFTTRGESAILHINSDEFDTEFKKLELENKEEKQMKSIIPKSYAPVELAEGQLSQNAIDTTLDDGSPQPGTSYNKRKSTIFAKDHHNSETDTKDGDDMESQDIPLKMENLDQLPAKHKKPDIHYFKEFLASDHILEKDKPVELMGGLSDTKMKTESPDNRLLSLKTKSEPPPGQTVDNAARDLLHKDNSEKSGDADVHMHFIQPEYEDSKFARRKLTTFSPQINGNNLGQASSLPSSAYNRRKSNFFALNPSDLKKETEDEEEIEYGDLLPKKDHLGQLHARTAKKMSSAGIIDSFKRSVTSKDTSEKNSRPGPEKQAESSVANAASDLLNKDNQEKSTGTQVPLELENRKQEQLKPDILKSSEPASLDEGSSQPSPNNRRQSNFAAVGPHFLPRETEDEEDKEYQVLPLTRENFDQLPLKTTEEKTSTRLDSFKESVSSDDISEKDELLELPRGDLRDPKMKSVSSRKSPFSLKTKYEPLFDPEKQDVNPVDKAASELLLKDNLQKSINTEVPPHTHLEPQENEEEDKFTSVDSGQKDAELLTLEETHSPVKLIKGQTSTPKSFSVATPNEGSSQPHAPSSRRKSTYVAVDPHDLDSDEEQDVDMEYQDKQLEEPSLEILLSPTKRTSFESYKNEQATKLLSKLKSQSDLTLNIMHPTLPTEKMSAMPGLGYKTFEPEAKRSILSFNKTVDTIQVSIDDFEVASETDVKFVNDNESVASMVAYADDIAMKEDWTKLSKAKGQKKEEEEEALQRKTERK